MAKSKDIERASVEVKESRAAGVVTRANGILAGAVALTLGVGFAAGYAVANDDHGPRGGAEAHGPVHLDGDSAHDFEHGPRGGFETGRGSNGGAGGPASQHGPGGPQGGAGQQGPGGQR